MCPIPHVQLQQQSVPKCFPLYQVQVDLFLLLFLRGVTSIFFSPFFVVFVGLWGEGVVLGGEGRIRQSSLRPHKWTELSLKFFLAPFSSLIPHLFIINIAPPPPPPLSLFSAFFSIPLFFSPHTFTFGTCIQNTYIHSFYIILSVHRRLSVFHRQNV